ncbi:MAG: glycine cleavage system aminomethyltransferase GcvT [Myxococcales bacterium]|nr:glycine cleavage system aminomethyltransferase GcvT [Myxococcales bacterium]USN50129.1 MAG: glycine cleavage system aminomethyltransferase GcvT [Myxococcales bacterium]
MTAKKTPLYNCHQKCGAHMVEFAQTLLPVRYQSEKEEHLAVRNHVGMFDVSHMGEFFVSGNEAEKFLNYTLSNNVEKLKNNQAHYSLMLNINGGIIDDLIVYKISPTNFLLCVNAANIDNDWKWLKGMSSDFDLNLENASDRYAQIALQGPKSIEILQHLCDGPLPDRFHFSQINISSMAVLIARTGYTGEDGVEIFVANDNAQDLWNIFLNHSVRPCGLAARDSLRLEAGMLLHGSDMDENTTPLEARLSFAVDFSKKFIGKDALILQKTQGLQKKLFGFRLNERGIARAGFKIFDKHQNQIGKVSSGTWPPSQTQAIGLAFCTATDLKNGDEIYIDIRGRLSKASVAKTKFIS